VELLAQHQKCCQIRILPAVRNDLLAVRLATVENRKTPATAGVFIKNPLEFYPLHEYNHRK
jgi:hypothetical protein